MSINLSDSKLIKYIKRDAWIMLIPLVLFVYWAITRPVGITNDTLQYAYMHIRRDPLYPLILLVFRVICGENEGLRALGVDGTEHYVRLVIWFQSILAWASIAVLTSTINKLYCKGRAVWDYIIKLVICLLAMAPYVITPMLSQSGLVITSTIMSEAITLPLFYMYIAAMLMMIEGQAHEKEHMQVQDKEQVQNKEQAELQVQTQDKSKYVWISLTLALLLSLARGQMMVMLIVWLIVAICVNLGYKKIYKILIPIIVFILTFGVRTLTVNTYNLVFNNYFMGTTFGGVSMLTNMLYASDEEDVKYIDDEEAQRFFLESMTLVEEGQYNYKYCDSGILNRAAHLEMAHDRIKFECIDECWRPIHDAEYPVFQGDYELETAEQDRVARIIFKDLLPHRLGRWIYDYIALCIYGFIRTVAIIHPMLNLYAALIYIIFIGLITVGLFDVLNIRNKKDHVGVFEPKHIRLLAFTLLIVLANVCGTATVIMCLSRYMIYVLPLVYISLLVVLQNLIFKH